MKFTTKERNVIFEIILLNEGFYSNDKDDNGKETIFGISRKYFPNLKIWEKIDELKKKNLLKKDYFINNYKDYIIDFYIENFIFKYNFHLLNNFLKIIFMFDFAINSGYNSIKTFEKAYNIKTKNELIEYLNLKNINEFYYEYIILRLKYYKDLTLKNKKYLKYLLGWQNRVFNLKNNFIVICKKNNINVDLNVLI